MKSYKVIIEEIYLVTLVVEADSPAEAKLLAEELVVNGMTYPGDYNHTAPTNEWCVEEMDDESLANYNYVP